MNGYSGTSFGPGDTLTRKQAAAVMWNLLGEGDASAPAAGMADADQAAWYAAAVDWAAREGVMTGYSGGGFGVGDALTREQFCAVVVNAAGALVSRWLIDARRKTLALGGMLPCFAWLYGRWPAGAAKRHRGPPSIFKRKERL